jgi:hypothetical protein
MATRAGKRAGCVADVKDAARAAAGAGCDAEAEVVATAPRLAQCEEVTELVSGGHVPVAKSASSKQQAAIRPLQAQRAAIQDNNITRSAPRPRRSAGGQVVAGACQVSGRANCQGGQLAGSCRQRPDGRRASRHVPRVSGARCRRKMPRRCGRRDLASARAACQMPSRAKCQGAASRHKVSSSQSK